MGLILNRDNMKESIGADMGTAEWVLIDQGRINAFADCTLDQQFIHVDPESAAKTPFGGTIAHGFLSLSLLSHFAESFGIVINGVYMGINYGFDSVRFISPVKVNSRIRAHAKNLEIIEKKPGQFMSKTEVTIEIEGEDKPALKAVWIGMQMVK